jgi:uncharacterized protein (TIGR00369 family)
MTNMASIAGDYPPQDHMTRDLLISLEFQGKERCTIQAPVMPEVCTDQGSMQVGVIATLVDLLGGALSLRLFHPDWQATSHLSIHTTGRAISGVVIAAGSVLQIGKNTVVFDVGIREEAGSAVQHATSIGSAMIICSRIPVREDTRSISMSTEAIHLAIEGSGLTQPYLDKVGVQVLDEAAGVVELNMSEYIRNSFHSLHGGMFATLSDLAGQQAARKATGRTLVTSDLEIYYLSPGKVGPFRTRARVLRTTDDTALTRVEVIDCGADDRLITVGMNAATPANKIL